MPGGTWPGDSVDGLRDKRQLKPGMMRESLDPAITGRRVVQIVVKSRVAITDERDSRSQVRSAHEDNPPGGLPKLDGRRRSEGGGLPRERSDPPPFRPPIPLGDVPGKTLLLRVIPEMLKEKLTQLVEVIVEQTEDKGEVGSPETDAREADQGVEVILSHRSMSSESAVRGGRLHLSAGVQTCPPDWQAGRVEHV